MKSEDILDKEIESWKGFEYALREENRTLFNKMLNNKEEYADCMSAKGENFSTFVYDSHIWTAKNDQWIDNKVGGGKKRGLSLIEFVYLFFSIWKGETILI